MTFLILMFQGILQESRIVRIMRKRLVRKTFDMIQDLAERGNKEDYKKFWENFGKFLKLGCIEDTGNHKRITPLLRFFSSKSEEEPISLEDYVENMGENQKAIYYLASDSLKSAKSAPFLENLVQKGIEVLYLVEPIDEVAIQNLQTYKENKFVDISKEDLELLAAACKNDPDSTDATRAVELLYDAALISSGFTPGSPAELGNKIYEMMAMSLGGRWGRSEDDEAEPIGNASETDESPPRWPGSTQRAILGASNSIKLDTKYHDFVERLQKASN